jgi:hypothetical protein
MVFVILEAALSDIQEYFWRIAVKALNDCNAIASADLSAYGIK